MFEKATAFNQPIGSWNTAAVTDFAQMFSQAAAFAADIGAWNTASATTMKQMFGEATAFNADISSWNTASVSNMRNVFFKAGLFFQQVHKIDGSTCSRRLCDLALRLLAPIPRAGWKLERVLGDGSEHGLQRRVCLQR
jgi:surface protein